MCSDANGMTDELRNIFLNVHNEKRSLVALGKAENGGGIPGYAPKAKKMLKMVYDCAIEENTMEYLKKCNFAHSSREERPGLGQNIWEFSDNNYDKSAAAARVKW
ncbi:SCP-like protein [Teladorsagia circumcincta]|uniref:SCP-like protein n=1 Tax=Teladorsagia circumcincta TaxID=45464 RepID=A0A2G9T8Y9_TELCI|nr:SCP-like protein [Teladorsagia circumcincta]